MVIKLTNQRAAARRKSGAEAGPEGSVTKLFQAEYNKRLQKLAVDMEGVAAVAWEGGPLGRRERMGRVAVAPDDARAVPVGFLRAQANTIEGGTSEIMRNILGERVLGLPGDVRTDKDVPWKDVPRSS